MALDPNINRIKFLRSTTAGNKPTVQMLAEGEIAINLADKTIYSTDGTNIIDLGFGLGGNVKGNIDATGYIKASNTIQSDNLLLAPQIGIMSSNGQGNGISLYSGWTAKNNMASYGMAFAQTSAFGSHGAVNSDWATYFSMDGNTNRGWIFKLHGTAPGLGNVASISAAGVATFARVDAPLAGNADTATRLKNNITINGIPFTGEVSVNNVPGWRSIQAPDDRTLKPNTSPKQSASAFFTTKAGLNGVADSTFGDMLVMNTWSEQSGGEVNGVFFPKNSGGNPLLYRAPIGSSTWGTPREFAMTDSNVATATRLEKSGRYASNVAFSVWAKFATVTVPQHGVDVGINFYGGSGYGTAPNSNGFSRITCRSGNNNPKSLTVVHERVDGHSFLSDVAYVQGAGDTWDLWGYFGAYTTLYYTVDMALGTNFVQQWNTVGGTNLPPGTVKAEIRTVAQITSNVASATKLQTPRNINGVPFDGTQDIRIQSSSIRIASGSLDDVLAEGNYYCDFDSDALNIANKPMAGSFALEVLVTAGVIQRFTNYNTGRTFVRKSYGSFGGWSEVFLNSQNNTVDAGTSTNITIKSSNDSALVLQNAARKVTLAVNGANQFVINSGSKSIVEFPDENNLFFAVNNRIRSGYSLELVGSEQDPIQRVQNANAAITINSPEPGMAAIRNSLDFGWYNDHFQLGAIRSGSQASHGFGITKGNNDLLWRVTPQGDMFSKGAVIAGAYLSATGDSTSQKVISRSGRFASADNFHYIDVGQNGRDLMTFAEYGAAFEFINTSNQQPILSVNPTGGATLVANAGYAANVNDSVQSNLVLLGRGSGAALRTNVGVKPAGWTVGYKPVVHAALQSDQGYVTNVSIGAYKSSNDWSDAGAYIAVGGSDTSPTEAFWFSMDGHIKSTTGRIKFPQAVNINTLSIENNLDLGSAIRSNAPFVSFLSMAGQARKLATGGILCSSSYADMPNVADGGIWAQNRISGQELVSRTFVDAVYANFASGVNITQAAGGGTTNGLRAGNMDAALYAGCNLDIQTHQGLGIKDNSGARRIVFDARTGTIHCQGPANVGSVASNGSITAGGMISSSLSMDAPLFRGKATEVAVANNSNIGASLKATWQGAVFYNAGCTAYVVDGNNLRLENIPLRSLGRFIDAGKSKVHIDTGHGTALRTGVITSVVATTDTSFYIIVNMPNHGIGNGLGMGIRAITYSGFGGSFAGALQNTNTFQYTWQLKLDSAANSWPSINVTTSTEWDGRWGPRDAAGLVGCGTAYDKSTVMFMVTDNNTDSNAMTSDYVSVQVWDVVG